MDRIAKMKNKIYFKVVFKPSNHGKKIRLYSCLSPAPISYYIGKFVRPREGCGPLAVFRDLSSAENFCNRINPRSVSLYYPLRYYLIFTCKIGKEIPVDIEAMWCTTEFKRKDSMYGDELPLGTILTDKVKLIEEFKYDEE